MQVLFWLLNYGRWQSKTCFKQLPIETAETAKTQHYSATARLGDVRNPFAPTARAGLPRGNQNRPSLRPAHDERSSRTHGSQWQPRRRGSTKYLLAKAPNFWTGQG